MHEQLENDTRKLFRKIAKYEIEDTGKEFTLESKEIDLLFEKKCLKNKNSKTTEIDIFGERTSDLSYILGECTYKARKKIESKISCFLLKLVSSQPISPPIVKDFINPNQDFILS